VALRLVVEREQEIEAFNPVEYWSIDADVHAPGGTFGAHLTYLDGKKVEKLGINNETDAKRAVDLINAQKFSIGSVESKPVKRNPSPPFITSSLQMEASRKLGFNAKHTMRIAQGLYEGVDIGGDQVGLITYMRTDGITMVAEAIAEARSTIGDKYGSKYVPQAARTYTSKAKNAQEAHEAIRPTSFTRTPEEVARYLEDDAKKLYDLIWKRAIASQMESAELERTTVDVISADKQITLRATGSVTVFDGFLVVYQESRDDAPADKKGDAADDDDGAKLPKVAVGEKANIEQVKPEQHFTEPPPRYSEASLVRKLEELGIGRPSTYASILSTLRDRGYVKLDRNRFYPDDKGRIVTTFLMNYFRRYVEYGFTADLEEKLDEVSAGELDWKTLLTDFWKDFSAAIGETKDLRITHVIDHLNEVMGKHIFPPNADGSDPHKCPTCGTGDLSLKLGRFGAFVGCSNYPECRYTRRLGQSAAEAAAAQPRVLGHDPETGEDIELKSGRFGPYIQRGSGDDIKRAGIPKGTELADVNIELALKLLALPREIGKHPEDGQPITTNFGRFGPYVAHNGAYASLDNPDEVFTLGINRAVTVLAEKKAKARPRGAPEALKELGKAADGESIIKVMKGRYGPYVTDGSTNATIPKDQDPNSVTLEQAQALIADREASGGGGKKKKKAPKKAAPAKKAKAEKPAADAKAKPAKAKAKPKAKKAAAKKPEPEEVEG
jgi:DNA topoisomerase-1